MNCIAQNFLYSFSADVDECTTGDNNCDENAVCTDSDGSFTCACKKGWKGDGTACTSKYHCPGHIQSCKVMFGVGDGNVDVHI